jgi:hypothetical protein
MEDYRAVNQVNWDDRADAHAASSTPPYLQAVKRG